MLARAAALFGAFAVVIAVVALEWYAHFASAGSVRAPVSAITVPPSPVAANPLPRVYVPVVTPTQAPEWRTAAGAPAATPAAGPLVGHDALPTPDIAVRASAAPAGATVPPIVPRENPAAPPQIIAMSLSSPVARGGEVVSGTVETSSNVASVVASIAGYSSALAKVGVGRFELSQRVPKLPFFLHRTYTIQVTARNARGDSVSSSLPITIH